MATSLPPQRKQKLTEPEIEAIINRGGSTIGDPQTVDDLDKAKFFHIRLTIGIFAAIDRLREKRPRKPGSPKLGISTHDWIVEAVLEKLEREREGA